MKNFLIFSVCCLVMLCGCASQQDVFILEDRLIRLEQQYAALERENQVLKSRFQDDAQSRDQSDLKQRDQYAGFYVRLENAQEEVRSLRGSIDETNVILNQRLTALEEIDRERGSHVAQVDRVATLNRERVERIEDYLNLEPSKTSTASTEKSPAGAEKSSQTKTLTEDELYAGAKEAFDRGLAEEARKGFETLIKSFPNSKNADNSQFWIGETYYREKWYEKAILEYQKVIEKYPKGNKVPAALLKQGLAFFNLDDQANGRLILKELVKKYPRTPEADVARKKLNRSQN